MSDSHPSSFARPSNDIEDEETKSCLAKPLMNDLIGDQREKTGTHIGATEAKNGRRLQKNKGYLSHGRLPTGRKYSAIGKRK